jgi:hypothetical protein
VKTLVKACGGKVDSTKLWNQFSSMRGKLKKINGKAAFGVSGSATGFLEFSYADGNLKLVDSGLAASLKGNASVRAYWFYVIYAQFGFEVSAEGKINLTLTNQKSYELNGSIGLSMSPSVAIGADLKVIDAQASVVGTLDGKFSFPASSMREGFELSLTGEIYIKVSSPIKFLNS